MEKLQNNEGLDVDRGRREEEKVGLDDREDCSWR
jgi:hypothetical protein